jgi:hypothetical protein
MTGMSLAELTEDTARSRAILEEGLGVTVSKRQTRLECALYSGGTAFHWAMP